MLYKRLGLIETRVVFECSICIAFFICFTRLIETIVVFEFGNDE